MIYDPKNMFDHACAFDDIANLCIHEPSPFKIRTPSHTVSGIVNGAFACEIFIKTLLIYNGAKPEDIKKDKHLLKKLWKRYKSIDEATARKIERNITDKFNSENDKLFSEKLNNISNAFKYWRYIYEKNEASLNMMFLVFFRTELRNECFRQLYNNSWEEYTNDRKKTKKYS